MAYNRNRYGMGEELELIEVTEDEFIEKVSIERGRHIDDRGDVDDTIAEPLYSTWPFLILWSYMYSYYCIHVHV